MIRFFSFDGRASRGRLLLCLAVALVAAWLCLMAFRTGAAAVMVPGGALLGAAVARLIVETVRYLRDAGGKERLGSVSPGRGGLALVLALAIVGGGTGYGFAAWSAALVERHARDADWAERERARPDSGPDALQQDYAWGNKP